MTTDPGDLVFDPTCGSGTIAFVAEKWGRRWITCDTSRVAVTLAKARLVTAGYEYYELKYPHEGLKGGFVYETVPHVTLKSIANNPEIDTIYDTHHPRIEAALVALNAALQKAPVSAITIQEGRRKGQEVDFKTPPSKAAKLLSGEEAPGGALLEWEIPFDLPDGWPGEPFAAFHGARQAMQKAMDASIAAHADQERLFDKPQVDKSKRRITGPFTVEAVPSPTVVSLDENEVPQEADQAIARSGHSARAHDWMDELLKTGIRGKGGQMLCTCVLWARIRCHGAEAGLPCSP
jgi:adenine-specific DNA-methyltransferase